MFQTKFVEKLETQILVPKLLLNNRAIYEIMWKNIVERGIPQLPIWSVRIACWIRRTTNTRSSCVIILAFPMQQ